jgi:hypothetical protein
MASYSGDGIRVVDDGPGRVVRMLLVAAAAVAVVTAVLIALGRRSRGRASAASGASPRVAAAPTVPAAPGTPAAPAPPAAVARDAPVDAQAEPVVRAVDRLRARRRAEAAAHAGTPPELDARDVIEYLRSRGERTGIAAFEPPGTDPPKSGIIVPDDFPLPEGYVRHYQSDDDGNPLPPILMFHPDFEFVDENGNRVALPENRVVPPELAPSGLPIRMLDAPKAPARPAP